MILGHALVAMDSNADHGLSILLVDHTPYLSVGHQSHHDVDLRQNTHLRRTSARCILGHTVGYRSESCGQTDRMLRLRPHRRVALLGHTLPTVVSRIPEEVAGLG